jgi:protein-disulfide isomerase
VAGLTLPPTTMRTKDLIRGITDVLLIVCAIALGTLVIKRELFAGPAEKSGDRTLSDWSHLIRGHELASSTGEVVLVEFSDFKCTYCRSFRFTLAALREGFGRRLSIRYRHFPLEGPASLSWSAALASECAAEQGQFTAFHDLMFAQQDSIGRKAWGTLASEAQVPDTARFRICLSTERYAANVQDDRETAIRLKLQGTPSVIINGVLVARTTEDALRARIIAELDRKAGT